MARKIQASGTYLYKLDANGQANLWGGSLNAQNGNSIAHVEKVINLILNAEDLQRAVEKLLEAASPQMTYRNAKEREAYALMRKAIENIHNGSAS